MNSPDNLRVVHVRGSPAPAGSSTNAVAKHFLALYRSARPGACVDTLDVWRTSLPAFDAEMIAAKFAVLRSHQATTAQRARWAAATTLARRFDAADLFVFSVPMWNFSIPYRLKHFIDVVTLPGENWRWSRAEGYRALLHGKRALLVYSSAGDYALDGSDASDFQKGYLRRWLAFIGIDDLIEINVAPTLAAPAELAESLAAAKRAAQRAVDTLVGTRSVLHAG